MFLEDIRFSLWCDFVERSFLKNDFKGWIDKGIVNGATSNPAIFKSAILSSEAYREDILKMKDKEPKEVYEALACEDIRSAADILSPLYQKGDDGFISIEIDPRLCDDAKESIEEGKRLFKKIDRENVMIKVPATEAGYDVIEELVANGIHVNVTLIFSPKQAKLALEAVKKGQRRLSQGVNFPQVVISVFVSRFDRKLDKTLSEKNIKEGLTGIYNAAAIYNMIESQNIINVRTLFASTGVKGDNFPKDYYIKELLYKNSINTAPLDTIKAFLQNENFEEKSPVPNELIDEYFKVLKYQNIDMEAVYDELMREGLEAFKVAFQEILDAIGDKK